MWGGSLNYKVNIQNIFTGLICLSSYIGFLSMFIWAIWKKDYLFHGGRIRGRLARAIGVIGLIGLAAGTYLLVSLYIFQTIPPFASLAGLLVGLLIVTVLVVKFLSIFMGRSK
jgi:hypothetical protein